jgi:hypothetical protein
MVNLTHAKREQHKLALSLTPRDFSFPPTRGDSELIYQQRTFSTTMSPPKLMEDFTNTRTVTLEPVHALSSVLIRSVLARGTLDTWFYDRVGYKQSVSGAIIDGSGHDEIESKVLPLTKWIEESGLL